MNSCFLSIHFLKFLHFTCLQDAQNKVAAYALFQLFPDIPVHLLITEPYALVVLKWMEGKVFFFLLILNFYRTLFLPFCTAAFMLSVKILYHFSEDMTFQNLQGNH